MRCVTIHDTRYAIHEMQSDSDSDPTLHHSNTPTPQAGEAYERPTLQPLGTPWYCVHSKPGKEKYALMHLERQDFECFLPMLKAKIVYRGKKQWVTAPMFRRYLFVRAVPGQDFSKIRSTLGVSRLVAFQGAPAFVPDEMISEIREHCEDDVYEQPEEIGRAHV